MKTIYFLLTFILLAAAGCKDDSDAEIQKYQQPFLGEWQEIERIDPLHPDRIVGARDTTIVFYPDGRFQGVIIDSRVPLSQHYSINGDTLRLTAANESTWIYVFNYSIAGNKLTLDLVYGAIPMAPSPTIFIYKKIKSTAP
jgi:hypothetical protein